MNNLSIVKNINNIHNTKKTSHKMNTCYMWFKMVGITFIFLGLLYEAFVFKSIENT